MERIDRSYIRIIRLSLQWGIFILAVHAGMRLYLFERQFVSSSPLSNGGVLDPRPPLVDGFLPIGALMGLRLWFAEGVFDPVHPAALVILLAAVATALILKKGFCGWICPVGTLSEAVYKIGGKLLSRNLRVHKYADYPLRSVKYILMGFFLYVVFIKMTTPDIEAFLGTPYWIIADIKMLKFFTEISGLTLIVLLLLFLLSLPVKNFWCRYLCPYGALLGLLSLASPLKITRNEDACTHCKTCTKNCPSLLPVERKKRVRSPECTGCLTCVSGCPSSGALDAALPSGRTLRPTIYALLILTVFFGIITAGKLTGHWHSSVSHEEYRALVPIAGRFGHP